MSFIDNRWYLMIVKITNYFLLSILLIIFMLPIITIVPALRSYFSVLDDLESGKTNIFLPYVKSFFYKNFFLDITVNFIFLFFLITIYLNINILLPISNNHEFVITLILISSLTIAIGLLLNYTLLSGNKRKGTERSKIVIVIRYSILTFGKTMFSVFLLYVLILATLVSPLLFFILTWIIGIIIKKIYNVGVNKLNK